MVHFGEGSTTSVIDAQRASELLDGMLARLGAHRRVLIVPPDFTRFHSWAGELTVQLYNKLKNLAHVEILPALGTHSAMSDAQIARMFPGIPREIFRVHDWRNGLTDMGTVPGEFIASISNGKVDYKIDCQVDGLLTSGSWDAIFSVGQLVPHEVIGIANHNKNILIGTGGKDVIDKSHFLGAVCNMERIMGRAKTPVRDALNYMSRNFTNHLPIHYVLTVRGKDEAGKLVTRGMYAGDDEQCFTQGAALCQQVNLDLLDKPIKRALVYLDPSEFKSTWLGNKAIYRTRLAMADDGELFVIGPGVHEFGEDKSIDALLRKYGYCGTPRTLDIVREGGDLAKSLSAAAHIIHGSTEGRFRVTWCAGGLTREEVEGAGYAYANPDAVAARFGMDKLRDGWNDAPDGEPIFYISNPALGLWALRSQFPANGTAA